MSNTTEIIDILTSKYLSARQLYDELNQAYEMESIHCVLNTLKKRNALVVVGKRTEISVNNNKRPSSVYQFVAPIKPLKLKESSRSRYRADLSKALKNKDRYKEMLLRKNYLFMMYSKELGLQYE